MPTPVAPVSPCVSPGCGAVTGPGRVLGFLGETLSVTCTYQTCWETLSKFCCKPATSIPPTCAEDFVISSELKPEVQQGRFSIWNNHTHWAFRVTVEGLAKRDTGTVHCGVGTGLLQFDEIADVEVILSPGHFLHIPCTATMTTGLGGWGQSKAGGVSLNSARLPLSNTSAGTPRPRPVPLSPGLPRSRRRGRQRQQRGRSGPFLPLLPGSNKRSPTPPFIPASSLRRPPLSGSPGGSPRSTPTGRALPRGRPREGPGLRREEAGAAAAR
uniref:Uncharacterized protein n=1 Tax=Corvus moneduloides TaxID=1196302 RepID=A0A8U7MUC3_CORMO